ncbi:MAG: hypothetical protein CM15mP49_19430 [Actinomycetota bacterium]|nr:MAG: hypothetical protein CM15mP49_19430 [Actinomycetota bacterium]
MEVEAPPRAQWIRTILFELSRIANVCLFLGDMAVQVGATTPVFYAFRDREFVLNQIERVTGGRFHPNFDRIGGLKDDLPKGWIEETRGALDRMKSFCDEMEELVLGNEIFQARTRNIGVIPGDVALSYGLSGANLRASGWIGISVAMPMSGSFTTKLTGKYGPTPTETHLQDSGFGFKKLEKLATS